ncbi:MAG: hypothetical protein MUF15_00450 [Acidobacteria bacterium]|jgi:hypothetical protein|nr:hypothetical protein [Acidobacteriota bacterium]
MSDRIDGRISLKVDGKDIPMNDFVRDVLAKVINGILNALDNIPGDRNKIEISIEMT